MLNVAGVAAENFKKLVYCALALRIPLIFMVIKTYVSAFYPIIYFPSFDCCGLK